MEYRSPAQLYHEGVQRRDYLPDAAQEEGVTLLESLFHELVNARSATSWWDRILNRGEQGSFINGTVIKGPAIKGLYFWGGVGRGKTFLMDIFYETLPFKEKMPRAFAPWS